MFMSNNGNNMTDDDYAFYREAFANKPYVYQKVFRLIEAELVDRRGMDRSFVRHTLRNNFSVHRDGHYYVLQFCYRTAKVSSNKKVLWPIVQMLLKNWRGLRD